MSQTIADTVRTTIKYIEESNWGEVPGTGALQALRFTGEALNVDRATTISDEIRDDRQISSLIPTKSEANGTIDGEMSYGTYDDFFASGLCSDWITAVSVTVSGVSINSTGKIVVPAASVQTGGDLAGVSKGMGLQLSGFTTTVGTNATDNNRLVVVKDIDETAGEITVAPALAETTGNTDVTFKGQVIKNGLATKSFYIEKYFADVDKILSYSGMVVGGITIGVEAEDKATIQLSFMGQDGETQATTQNPAGTDASDVLPQTTTEIMAAGAQDGMVLENDQVIGLIKSINMQIENNLRTNMVIGSRGGVSIGKGRFM